MLQLTEDESVYSISLLTYSCVEAKYFEVQSHPKSRFSAEQLEKIIFLKFSDEKVLNDTSVGPSFGSFPVSEGSQRKIRDTRDSVDQ